MPISPSTHRHHYYSFGSSLKTRSYSAGNGFRFGFNGKEKQGEFDNDDYDFGARFYDGRLGRWFSVDPLMLNFPSVASFVFCINSPLSLIDFDGLAPSPPLHFEFFTDVAIQIYNAAKANGASEKGALFVISHAALESGYAQSAIKYGDFNLFGTMTNGNDYKRKTKHGKVKDFSNSGGYIGSMVYYFKHISVHEWTGLN